VLTIGHISFSRNRRLREITERLRHGEKALMAANEALQERLDEIDQLQQKLGELVNLDPLTGLYNRRYLNTTLDRELARCARENQPMSMMMIDIDHFKRVNDTHGHQAGDEVLAQLGALLCENARTEDIACRYGGEEFLLLLPKMPLPVALKRAEELRTAFAKMAIQAGDRMIKCTLSIGISGYPVHGISPDILVRRADIALYSAKAQGRDQVVMFSEDAMSPSIQQRS
jgi:diguanylate cyclase (GGDEF)-like protein